MSREKITNLEDKNLTCKICGANFTFSIGEQEFYRDRGLAEPRRCPTCRAKRKATVNNGEMRQDGY